MKHIFPCLPALLLAAALSILYGVRATYENKLRETRAKPPGKPADPASDVIASRAALSAFDEPDSPETRNAVPLTREQGLRLLDDSMTAAAVPPGTVITEHSKIASYHPGSVSASSV